MMGEIGDLRRRNGEEKKCWERGKVSRKEEKCWEREKVSRKEKKYRGGENMPRNGAAKNFMIEKSNNTRRKVHQYFKVSLIILML